MCSKGFNKLSQNIAHFGFSLLILSILFNNIFSTEIITNLKIGETFESEKFKINFMAIEQKNEQNYKAIIETLEKEKSNVNIKGELIKKVYATSTMGGSYKIKLEKGF